MDKRISRIERETAETNITVEFDVDGSGLVERAEFALSLMG